MTRSRILALLFALLGLVQFVPGVGLGEARAACTYGAGQEGSGQTCATRQLAWEVINAENSYLNSHSPQRFYTIVTSTCGTGYSCYKFTGISNGYGAPAYYARWLTASPCPAGTTWNDASKTCFSTAACLAHNAEDGFKNVGAISRLFHDRCVGGCDYRIQAPFSSVTVGSQTLYNGEYMFTGDPCAADQPPATEPDVQEKAPQECVPASAGQTVCVKSTGEHCYSGPIGRPMQFCWRPGEAGQKTSQDLMQVRGAGTTVPPATPPAGDTANAVDAPMQSTTTTAAGVTFTTTTQNYTTASGLEAGSLDQGEPADGSGSAGAGDDGDKGTVEGGVDCDSPPQVTGDPVLANVVLQTWGTRCAVESSKSVTSTGVIDKCAQPWTISGPDTDVNVAKLKALRSKICGSDDDGNGIGDAYEGAAPTREEGIASGDVNSDGSGGGGPDGGAVVPAQAFGTPVEGGDGSLDFSGWSSWTRTCPTIPDVVLPNGAHIPFSTVALCNIMQTLGVVFLTLASLFAAKIMAGGIE